MQEEMQVKRKIALAYGSHGKEEIMNKKREREKKREKDIQEGEEGERETTRVKNYIKDKN